MRGDVLVNKERERVGSQVAESSQDEGRAGTQLSSFGTYGLNGEVAQDVMGHTAADAKGQG